MFRVSAMIARRVAPTATARRFNMHQNNEADDLSWLESDAKMSAEERFAYIEQQKLLKSHAEKLNEKYEEEHRRTRDHMEVHQTKNAAKIASLEAKIAELTSMVQQMKAENK